MTRSIARPVVVLSVRYPSTALTDRGPVLHNRENRAPKLPPNHRVTNASFCKSLRITHMQTAWGYRPKILSKCSNGIAAGNRPFHQRTRPHDRRLSEPNDKKSGAAVPHNQATTAQRREEYKTMPLRQIESVRLNVSCSGLRSGPHCILSCFLGVVASCTASRTQLLGSPLFLPPADCSRVRAYFGSAQYGCTGSTWSPRNNGAGIGARNMSEFCSARFLRR